MRIGVNIDSVTDTDQMKMRAVFHSPDSLVIGLSISGETKEVLYFLEEAKLKGAKTVLITSLNREELREICDEIVLVPSLQHLNYGNVISPQFPLSIMVDLLYSFFVDQDKNIKEKLHDDTLRALRTGFEGNL